MTEKSQRKLRVVFSSKGKGKSCEADWAKLFLKMGLDFEYEPTLFNFGDGTGFCPDFYFPEQNVYVEVTVTRHIGRKNKKLRLVQEAHPGATFILLTRHEHRVVFGGEPFEVDMYRIDAWSQVSANLSLLLNSLIDPLTSKAA